MMMGRVRRDLLLVLHLLGSALFLPAVLGQEEAQEVTEYYEDSAGNSANDIGVSAIYFEDELYIAATTTGALEGANEGGVDFIVKTFDTDLAPSTKFIQYGGTGDDNVYAIVGDPVTTNVVIVGSTEADSDEGTLFDWGVATGGVDWFIAVLDRSDLEVSSSYINGSTYEDQEAKAVAVTSDGDYIVAGETWGEYFAENAGSDNDDEEIGLDVWLVKIASDLDPNDGDFEWNTQFGTIAYDRVTAMVIDDSDYVYVTGYTTDDNGVVDDPSEVQSIFVYCLNGDTGDIEWATTTELGSLEDESEAYGIVMSEDGSEVYVSGHTYGIIPGYEGNSTGKSELFLVSLDAGSGDINWVYQSEGDATAHGRGGVVLAEDGSPIISGIAYGNQFNLTETYWEDGAGDMIAVKIDPDTQEVLKYFVAVAASNQTEEEAFAMVTDPDVEDGVFLLGQENGEFGEVDSVADDEDLNYLLLKIELEELPEEEETDDEDDDDDDTPDYDYWPIGVALVVVGGLVFVGAYKWAQHSVARKARIATMV